MERSHMIEVNHRPPLPYGYWRNLAFSMTPDKDSIFLNDLRDVESLRNAVMKHRGPDGFRAQTRKLNDKKHGKGWRLWVVTKSL